MFHKISPFGRNDKTTTSFPPPIRTFEGRLPAGIQMPSQWRGAKMKQANIFYSFRNG